MGNKTQLQLNNETLASILSNVLGLPSQESLKQGLYVWKKSVYTSSGTISVSFISTSSTETKVQLSSSDVDLSTLQDDDFITLRLGGTMDAITILSKVYTKYKFLNLSGYKRFRILTEDESYNLNYGYSFNATTNILTLTNLDSSSYALPEINLSSMVVPAITGDFVDFVVSDSPTTYPYGAVHTDGYWYEKFQLDPTLFGCTKYAVDKFTYSSRTSISGAKIAHSLGEIPSIAIVIIDNFNNITVNNDVPFAVALNQSKLTTFNTKINTIFLYLSNSSYFNVRSETNGSYSESEVILSGSTTFGYFAEGIEYTLITMI